MSRLLNRKNFWKNKGKAPREKTPFFGVFFLPHACSVLCLLNSCLVRTACDMKKILKNMENLTCVKVRGACGV